MSQDLATLAIRVDSSGVTTASRDLNKLEADSRKVETATQSVSSQFTKLQGVVMALAASYAALKVAQYIKDATMLAARYETLGVVMRVVGNNAGYTGAQMEAFSQGLQKAGIAMVESRNTLARMIQAQIDLKNSQKLARIAQDAAVIGNMNSSQSFEQMIYGIQTGMPRILRTIGLNVDFNASEIALAASLGKKRDALSEAEVMQGRVNAIVKAGILIEGTYTGAMGTAGKQVLSLQRHLDNLKALFGQTFTPALSVLIESVTGAVTDLNGEFSGESKAAIASWGRSFADAVRTIIDTIKSLASPVVAAMKLIWEFRDAIIALGIAFAAFNILTFISSTSLIIPTMASIAMALNMAKIAVWGFLWSLGPVGLATLALSAIIGGAYFAYKKLTGGTEEAKKALIDFQQKADSMDMAQIEGELESVRIKMANIKEINDKFVFNPFGKSEKLDPKVLADIERFLIDKREVLRTEQQMVKIRKELNDLSVRQEAADAKKAEATKKAIEDAKKLREEWEKVKISLEHSIQLSGLEGLSKDLLQNQFEADALRKLFEKLPPAERAVAYATIEKGKATADATARSKEGMAADEEYIELEKKWASETKALREAEIGTQLHLLDIAEIQGRLHIGTLSERLRLEKELLQINQEAKIDKGKDPTGYLTQLKAIEDSMRKIVALEDEIAKADPFKGMLRSYQAWAEDASNIGKSFGNTVTKAFDGMADALTAFVTTGKMDFKSLADSIVADLIRIFIREQMVKTFSFIGGLFGGGVADPALGAATHVGGVVFHSGGIVGFDYAPTRDVSPTIFNNAPRFHSGLSYDEFPAILQRGEEVIPRNKVANNQTNNSKDDSTTNNNFFIQAVDAKSFAELCRTNPAAIAGPVMQQLRDNKIRSEFKSLVR